MLLACKHTFIQGTARAILSLNTVVFNTLFRLNAPTAMQWFLLCSNKLSFKKILSLCEDCYQKRYWISFFTREFYQSLIFWYRGNPRLQNWVVVSVDIQWSKMQGRNLLNLQFHVFCNVLADNNEVPWTLNTGSWHPLLQTSINSHFWTNW